jgi:hypothetical protein
MKALTKNIIASVLAVAMAGPAASKVNMHGVFEGSNTTFKIIPAGCPNAKDKNIESIIGFGSISELDLTFPNAGCWFFAGEKPDSEVMFLDGLYIEKKVSKDLTMSLTGESLLDSIFDEVNEYILTEPKCNYDGGMDPDDFYVKKGNGKLSKNGDRIKLNILVYGHYTNDRGNNMLIKTKIQGKMDFNANAENPAYDCSELFVGD